jgi:hypothetical protein
MGGRVTEVAVASGTSDPSAERLRCVVGLRFGGRYRTRTDDLFRVKEARYQLRQSP